MIFLRKTLAMFVLLIAMLVVGMTNLSAKQSEATTSDTTAIDSHHKLSFQFSAGTELFDGYTEYEINAGQLHMDSPDGPFVPVRSRLRFPVNSTIGFISVSGDFDNLILSVRLGFQLANQRGLFRDYDWFEQDGLQKTFIYGEAENDDKTSFFEADGGLCYDLGRFTLTPRVRFKYLKMQFVERGVDQTNYYAIDTATIDSDFEAWLVRLDEPVTTKLDKSTEVLNYQVVYKTLYAGGSIAYAFPFGMDAEFTALGSPIAIVDDLDNHLVRDPPKDSRISATRGNSGILDLRLAYRVKEVFNFWAGITYEFVTASGLQNQIFLDESPVTIENISAKTKAEWSIIRMGINITFSP